MKIITLFFLFFIYFTLNSLSKDANNYIYEKIIKQDCKRPNIYYPKNIFKYKEYLKCEYLDILNYKSLLDDFSNYLNNANNYSTLYTLLNNSLDSLIIHNNFIIPDFKANNCKQEYISYKKNVIYYEYTKPLYLGEIINKWLLIRKTNINFKFWTEGFTEYEVLIYGIRKNKIFIEYYYRDGIDW